MNIKKIIIYSTDLCGLCTMSKEHLRERGIEFEERMVGKEHPKIGKEMLKLNGGLCTVPTVIIENEKGNKIIKVGKKGYEYLRDNI